MDYNELVLEETAGEYATENVFGINGHLFSNNNDEAPNAIKCSIESFKAGVEWQKKQTPWNDNDMNRAYVEGQVNATMGKVEYK